MLADIVESQNILYATLELTFAQFCLMCTSIEIFMNHELTYCTFISLKYSNILELENRKEKTNQYSNILELENRKEFL